MEWAGYKGLPKGHWVYVYPHWYIWEEERHKAGSGLHLEKASAKGKYTKLLAVIHVPGDKDAYGEFKDYGAYEGNEWAGYKGLPKGYWVDVYPYWYIWEGGEQIDGIPGTRASGVKSCVSPPQGKGDYHLPLAEASGGARPPPDLRWEATAGNCLVRCPPPPPRRGAAAYTATARCVGPPFTAGGPQRDAKSGPANSPQLRPAASLRRAAGVKQARRRLAANRVMRARCINPGIVSIISEYPAPPHPRRR